MARENLTIGRITAFRCPADKAQAFLWDATVPGLALRVTAADARSFVFQSRHQGKALRLTIGDPANWTIPGARTEARRLQTLLDRGIDPRVERAQTKTKQAEIRQAAKVERLRGEVSGLDAWGVYVEARRAHWGERNYLDHLRMAKAGGEPRKRMPGETTQPGPLRSLLARPLAQIDAKAIEQWLVRETRTRPARAALGFRLMIVFLNWCAEHDEYRHIVVADACKSRSVREKLGKPARKTDALQREQLRDWFAEVRKLESVPAAYLQILLLVGARREELAELRWADVDLRWMSMRLKDKVEGERVIPLTPYVASLLLELKTANERPPVVPRRLRRDPQKVDEFRTNWQPSPWVFSSSRAEKGYLQEPRIAHNRALAAAGLPHITMHGLRRSFGTLAEWVEAPVGIVAQIQGHKPSAIAEKHYRVRPLDLLRRWHERIEAWMLEQGELSLAPNAPAPSAAGALSEN